MPLSSILDLGGGGGGLVCYLHSTLSAGEHTTTLLVRVTGGTNHSCCVQASIRSFKHIKIKKVADIQLPGNGIFPRGGFHHIM